MTTTNPKVDGYIRKHKQWQAVLSKLRAVALDCPLTEDIKWRVPCYTFGGANVVIVNALKDYCALSFFKGALLKDAKGLLDAPGPNTQSGRLIRFTDAQEVERLAPMLKAYIHEAIAAEKAGLKVEFKKEPEPMPEELQQKLNEDAQFKAAFEALTPGRQRGYILHFSGAKQSKTRASRIEKCRDQILAGKGMHD